MLKRQRPATPPPSSLGDPPSSLPDGLIRPPQALHTADPSQPRSKRQRTQPPPLDGTLRGWLGSESVRPQDSDGEEDWIEDTPTVPGSPSPSSTTASQYKDTNNLLHELHVLNQHRLLFVDALRDQCQQNPRAPLPAAPTHGQDYIVGQRQPAWIDGSSPQPAPLQSTRDGLAGRSHRIESLGEKALVEEVQCVRRRYESANRLLFSLFLSRKRQVEGTSSSADPDPSS